MVYDEVLATRIRRHLSGKDVVEKKMFGSLCFMVDGKMCVCAGEDSMLCRLSEVDVAQAIQQAGIVPMIMRGRASKSYVRIARELLVSEADFQYWIDKALGFNKTLTESS